MAFNFDKLKGRIVEIFGSQAEFAKAMEWSQRTASLKLNGLIPWNQKDIAKAVHILRLDESDIPAYFFTIEVQNVELCK